MKELSKYIIIALLLVAGFLFFSSYSSNSEIKELRQKNDSLLLKNRELALISDSLKSNIDSSNLLISYLRQKDESLKYKIVQLNNKIQIVRVEYEKANNHANNFNSLDIQRYFSELQ